MLALRPDLVDQDAIVDDGDAPSSPLLRSDMLTAGPTVRSMPFDRITQSGVWGKPSLASAQKGRVILDNPRRQVSGAVAKPTGRTRPASTT